MPSITIHQQHCIGCGQCLDACPFGAIALEQDADNQPKARILDNCTLCGACVSECPTGAIELSGLSRGEADFSAYQGIWVYAEQSEGRLRQVAFELLHQAARLARDLDTRVTAIVLGSGIAGQAAELIAAGADRVILVEHAALAQSHDLLYTDIIARLTQTYQPAVFLLGATAFGRSLAPRLAARLRTGLTADCTGLEIDGERGLLVQTRPAFGGNLLATIICPQHRPQMATVRPHVFPLPKMDYTRQGEIIREPYSGQAGSAVQLLGMLREQNDGVNINDADILISVGKGIGSVKNIALAEELAALLKGAVASSRPLVDSGWLGYTHQVGQTGKTVVPKLYLACGISGAVQHMAGVAAETIVAVNNDPEAPIFNYAHYAVQADCVEFLCELIALLKAKGGTSDH